jgi:VWFA-related protein
MRRPRSSARTLLALLLAIALAAPPAFGQDARDVFGEVIDVRVVNFETVVADKSGRRITGLTRDDFRLLVDGREVPIDYFSEVRDGLVYPEQASFYDKDGGSMEDFEPEEARHTNYLVFVDDVFSIGAQRNLVLKALSEQLSAIGPKDRVAVMSFGGGDVERLTNWTSAPEEIRGALEGASKRKAKGAFRRSERAVFNPAYSQQEAYIRLVEGQLENLIVAASIAMRSAAPATGRKVLLLLSGGWPFELSIYEDPSLRSTFRGSGSMNELFLAQREQFGRNLWSYGMGVGIYQTLADTANLLGYTIYPIDVPGVSSTGADVTQDALTPDAALRPSSDSTLEASLLFLADETGGKAMLNSNRLQALDRVVEDTSSYYWLGFTSDRRANNQRHRVQLEARNPDYRVRTRKDYVDFSRNVEIEMMVEGALLFQEEEDPSDFSIVIGETRRIERKKMEVPIRLDIPVEELTHLFYEGSYLANMTVTVAVKDKRDTLSTVQTMPFQASNASLPEVGQFATYEMDLQLWREPHDLVVMVQDIATGTVLSSTVRIVP